MKTTVVGFQFNVDSPFMNSSERSEFKRLLDGRALSFYRLGFCEVCGAKVIKGKAYCSKACYEHKMKERDEMETVEALINRPVELETVDSIRRKGQLTGIKWGHVEVEGKKVHYPIELELNDDSTEKIPWASLKWLREGE
jgi:hypothetical protein